MSSPEAQPQPLNGDASMGPKQMLTASVVPGLPADHGTYSLPDSPCPYQRLSTPKSSAHSQCTVGMNDTPSASPTGVSPVYATMPDIGSISRPPPQVMTALGPMPLPPEIRRKIPEKFVAKPIIEEREIYIAKKEVQERTIEVPHVHYEHRFAEISKSLKIKKLVPSIREVFKEVPREVYKPVIEEKIIEVPQGVKYVEVPVEVPCLYPPKIVPKPKVQVVERIVETIKPVVKEKIIEVPQTVVKQVPKIKTVEVPYYVPRYVEKVIEIPYRPPHAASLPPILQGALPQSIVGGLPHNGIVPDEMYLRRSETGTDMPGSSRMAHISPSGQPTTIPNTDGMSPSIHLPEGFQWGAPSNAPGFRLPLCSPPPPPGGPGVGRSAPDGDPRMLNMPPLMVTCPPEVGRVNFSGYLAEPDILTRQGVMPYAGFRAHGNFHMLFPPLFPQPGVPMDPPGTPDVKTMQEINMAMNETHGIDRFREEAEILEQDSQESRWPCVPPPPKNAGIVYEQ